MSSVWLESCSSFKTTALEVFPHLVIMVFLVYTHMVVRSKAFKWVPSWREEERKT